MLANLRALFGVIVDIVLLRRGPEHLPASPALLAIVVALYAVVSAVVASQITGPEHSWSVEVLGISITLLWYHVALTLARKRERFTQTAMAVFACRALFTPLLLPISSAVTAHITETQTAPAGLGMLVVVLIVWLLVIEVRIARAALEWPTLGAVGVVLGREFTSLIIFALVFGVPAKTP